MRRHGGFTLIELIVVIAIMGAMSTVAVASIRRGRSNAQLAGATRDVMAMIRHARSVALVTQKPSIVTYSNETVDDENVARITFETAKLFDNSADEETVQSFYGEELEEGQSRHSSRQSAERDRAAPELNEKTNLAAGEEASALGSDSEGETINETLTPPLSTELTQGLRIKVLKEDEQLQNQTGRKIFKSSISVFSTSGFIRQQLNGSSTTPVNSQSSTSTSTSSTSTSSTSTSSTSTSSASTEPPDPPVEITWSTNGRAEAHTIWIYPDGGKPEDGLSIEVDKFGGCKVTQWEEAKR